MKYIVCFLIIKLVFSLKTSISQSILDNNFKFCRNHCNSNGYCFNGKCFCKPGYNGDDCGIARDCGCKNDGKCLNGICVCMEGFAGPDCSISNMFNYTESLKCLNGEYFNRKCYCYNGFKGENCEISITYSSDINSNDCVDNCNNNGKCYDGLCRCYDGYIGHTCAKSINIIII